MWALITLHVICSCFIVWSLFGYYIFFFIISLFKVKKEGCDTYEPHISIIVPCYNEEKYIVSKIENLKLQDYPLDKVEFIFVDGGSRDKTIQYIEENIKFNSNFKLIQSPEKGKINQINYVLPSVKGEIIIITDVDGIMKYDCIRHIVSEFSGDNNIGVVGAYVYPEHSIPIESCYWDAQNKGRFLESDAFTSSFVIAVCYAFKKGFLYKFPEDVVADDIYIAYWANTLGYNVLFSRKAIVAEIRTPKNYSDFFSHKFRKANAFLRENLRFLYRLPEMRNFWKIIYMTKVIQLSLLPWLNVVWCFLALSLITLWRYDVVFWETVCIMLFFILTSLTFKLVKLPLRREHYNFKLLAQNYICTTFILLATGFTYPFFTQSSSYRKI
ncbi:MAG: glycosyltransferase [Candidatus Eremiobacterota bacterium]